MRAVTRTCLIILLIVANLIGCTLLAEAAEEPNTTITPYASDYFDSWRCSASPAGNGNIYIYFKVTATRTMSKLGVSSIAIYKELPNNAGYTMVHSYNSYSTSGLLGSGLFVHSYSTTYQAEVGGKYYASFAFYAENASGGSETRYYSTLVITVT